MRLYLRLQQAGQRVGRIDRPLSRSMPVKRQEDLPIRKLRGQPVSSMNCKCGLAYPSHPSDCADSHHPADNRSIGHCFYKVGKLPFAAYERSNVTRQRPRRKSHGPVSGTWTGRVAVPPWTRAAASNAILSAPVRPSASASRRAVSFLGSR